MIFRFWQKLSFSAKVSLVFGVVLLLRLVFMTQIGLIDDEAYHWSWAKELSLSYFDHPGLIAWLEAGAIAVFGESEWAVRLPAFFCYILTIIVSFRLVWEMFGAWPAAFTSLMILFTPLWGFGGFVASPEPPFMMFWVLGAYVFWRGYNEQPQQWSLAKTWVLLGLIMGLGLNAKFMIALLAFGFAAYFVLTPRRLWDLLTPWPWLGVLLAAVLCLPIFVWNVDYGWPGFQYQFHDRHAGSPFSVERWAQFFIAQILLFTPFLYLVLVMSLFLGLSPSWRRDVRFRLLVGLALPSLLLFYLQPLWADYKPHWSGPACLFLTMIGGYFLSPTGPDTWVKRQRSWLLKGIAGFLVFLNLTLYSPFLYPFVPKVARAMSSEDKWKPTYDLSNEFFGWKALGNYLHKRTREIHVAEGRPPFLSSYRYETTAQTYWGTKEKTFQLSRDRSHYSVIQSPVEMTALLGRNTLFVTSEKYSADPMGLAVFDNCTPETFEYFRADELARVFTVYYCENFQGIR